MCTSFPAPVGLKDPLLYEYIPTASGSIQLRLRRFFGAEMPKGCDSGGMVAVTKIITCSSHRLKRGNSRD